MRKLFTSAERKTLMGAGFPRQSVRNWENGAIPRTGNQRLISMLLGRTIRFKKNRKNIVKKGRLNGG